MKLNCEALRPLLFGAAELREERGGLRGYKCTEPVRKAWHALADWLETYASHSTGIRVDLETDASRAAFSVCGGKFEIKIDGLTRVFAKTEDTPTVLETDLPAGAHRITLVFPSHGNGIVFGAELTEASFVRPHAYREKIHFMGDSITQGWDAEWDSLSYAWQVSEFFDADMLIHGVGGSYFHPSVFEKAPFEPDRVVVALGTNDFSWGIPLEQLRKNTAAYLDRVKEAYGSARVTCILPIWRGEESKKEELRPFFDQVVAMIRAEEEKRGFRTVDGLTLVPHSPEFFTKDLLHPNALGFSVYARSLIRILSEQ